MIGHAVSACVRRSRGEVDPYGRGSKVQHPQLSAGTVRVPTDRLRPEKATRTMTFAPTDEQLHIQALFRTGNPLLVRAGAGTGKTSTLLQLADILAEQDRIGLYLAFNKSIADEAGRKFGAHVTASTAHALAFRNMRRTHSDVLEKLRMGKIPFSTTAKALNISPLSVPGADGRPRLLTSYKVTRHVLRTVERFCTTADTEIRTNHVPSMVGLDALGDRTNHDILAAHIVPLAQRAWADLQNPAGHAVKFSHGHYLKLWALADPRIGPDGAALFLDEAQDCQPAGTVVRMVGGETKPIELVEIGDRVVSYFAQHACLKVRGKPVTNVASRRHSGELIRVETESGLTTRYTPEHITFAKVGSGFEGKKLVYLMRRGNKFRVGITSPYHGGGGQRRSSGLAGRMHEEGGDAMWVLAAYDTKGEALVEEARASVTFGIPDVVFNEEPGRSAWGQELIDGFWHSMGDMTDRAARCLAAYGRMIEHPLATRKFNAAGNRAGYLMLTRTVTIRACNLMDGMRVLDARPLVERRNHKAYRSNDPAWTRTKIVREQFNGTVYSLEVADDHSYVGDDIVTHNCAPVLAGVLAKQTHLQKVLVGDASQSIYRFTGATNAMNKFGELPEGRLTRSWRFGQEVADAANHLLAELGDDLRLSGNPAITSQVASNMPDVDTILTRTNGVALEQVMEAQRAGKRVHLMGDQQYALRFCEGAEKLMAGEPAGHEDLAAFTTWGQVQDHAEDSPDSSDWKTLVDLIETHGVPAVKDALARTVPESSAQLTVATAHRSKGREWNRVQLADDLADQLDSAREAVEEGGNAADRAALADELMLNYVAATRARTVLGTGRVIPPELHTRTVHPAAQAPVTPEAQPDAEAALTLPFAGTADGELVTIAIEFAPDEAARIRAVAGEKIADWLYELAMTATTDRSVA